MQGFITIWAFRVLLLGTLLLFSGKSFSQNIRYYDIGGFYQLQLSTYSNGSGQKITIMLKCTAEGCSWFRIYYIENGVRTPLAILASESSYTGKVRVKDFSYQKSHRIYLLEVDYGNEVRIYDTKGVSFVFKIE